MDEYDENASCHKTRTYLGDPMEIEWVFFSFLFYFIFFYFYTFSFSCGYSMYKFMYNWGPQNVLIIKLDTSFHKYYQVPLHIFFSFVCFQCAVRLLVDFSFLPHLFFKQSHLDHLMSLDYKCAYLATSQLIIFRSILRTETIKKYIEHEVWTVGCSNHLQGLDESLKWNVTIQNMKHTYS